MSSFYKVDTKEFEAMLKDLSPKSMKAAKKAGLRKSMSLIANAARSNLRGISKSRSLQKGIRTVVYKDATGAIVTLKNTKTKGNALTRIFEVGTKNRYARWSLGNGVCRRSNTRGYRGRILPGKFLQKATQQKMNAAIDALEKNISEYIEKKVK